MFKIPEPADIPNGFLGIDTETYDPELLDYGPGWGRGAGHLLGFSIARLPDRSQYLPIGHVVNPEQNLDEKRLIGWLEETINSWQVQVLVGANLLYDLGWLTYNKVSINYNTVSLFDVQYAEALLDAHRNKALDDLAERYLDEKKDHTLYELLASRFGGLADGTQRKNIFRASAEDVAKYAAKDALLPLKIMAKQDELLLSHNLREIFYVECALIPLYIEMRLKGVSVDLPYTFSYMEELSEQIEDTQKKIPYVNVNSGKDIARMCDREKISYSKTSRGNATFSKAFLKKSKNSKLKLVLKIRELLKIRDTFLRNYILETHKNAKIYTQFHPLLLRGNGTVTGRYASSTPNLQNIPKTQKARACFIPDELSYRWVKLDYSQIEYRLLLHFSKGSASKKMIQAYHKNPNLDYHQFVIDLVLKHTGIALTRTQGKAINFGFIYGMGIAALCDNLNIGMDAAIKILDGYEKAVPFAKVTMHAVSKAGKKDGEVRTIGGRRIEVLNTHSYRALNYLIQGSAADIIKIALLQCYKKGLFSALDVPRILVHDELDFGIYPSKANKQIIMEIKHVMETAVENIRVPLKVDLTHGKNWGECK